MLYWIVGGIGRYGDNAAAGQGFSYHQNVAANPPCFLGGSAARVESKAAKQGRREAGLGCREWPLEWCRRRLRKKNG